jgi:hypothetical protein
MLHSLTSQIAFLTLFASASFAFIKGGAVERWAAAIVCVSWSLSVSFSVLLPGVFSRQIEEFTFLAVDAATAVGLLALALRFASIWLGVAMLMQSAELGLHGAIMADWGLPFRDYMMLNNALSFGLLLLIASATGVAWFNRSSRNRATVAEAVEGLAALHGSGPLIGKG